MPSIQELRNNYSVLDENNFSDEDVIQWVANQTGETPQEVSAYLAPAEEAYEYDPYAALDSSSGLGDNSQYESEDTTGWRDVGDVGTGLLSGTAKAAGAIVGLGSLVPGLHYIADPLSAWLQKGGEAIDEALLSDRQQEINQELSTRLQAAAGELGPDASYSDYFDAIVSQGGEAGSFVADHPGQVANLIATSIPYIFGGGAITKGVKGAAELAGLKKVSEMGGITGAAVGEGAITSGEVTKNIIEKTGTSGDYTAGRLAAVPAGLGTAGISLISGRVASKAGVADIDVAVTNKIAGTSTDLVAQASKKGLVRSTLTGSATEATEELFQGGQEKIFENIGTGEHPLTDVGGDAVMGAFAGAGQGAGINVIKSMSGSDVQLTQAQKEEESKIAAEQAQEMEDEEFIADAGAIASTQDSRAFAVKWSKILGVSTDEVFQDPRFGVVQEERELQAQEDATKEKRRIHAPTFPDEKVWYKENDAEKIERQRMDIANEQTELGSAFATWQKDNDVYDSNDEVIEDFLSDPAIQDLLPELDDSREPYFAALDAHANFKEQEATRTEEEQQQAEAVVAELLTVRNEAVSNKDLGGIAAVEQRAAEVLDPAEWSIAKRNNAGPKKGKAKAAAKPVVAPVENKTLDTEAPIVVASPYKENSKKDLAHKEATEALGDLEAYPEITKTIESKKGVYGTGDTPFSRALAKAKVQKRLSELGSTTEGGLSTDKSSAATKNVGVKVAAAVASGEIELTNTQVKVLDVILDAIETDTLGEYFYGDSKTGSAAIAKAAGLKGRSTADAAVKSIMGYFTEFAGEGTKEQLKATKNRTADGKTLKEASKLRKEPSASTEDFNQALQDEGYVPDDTEDKDYDPTVTVLQDSDETTTDENTEGDYERGETAVDEDAGEVATEQARYDTGMGTIGAGGAQTNIAAPDTAGKEWVDERAEASRGAEDKTRLNKARKEQESLVNRVMGDKAIAKKVSDSWNESKPEDASSFDGLPITAKFVWINAVGAAMESGDSTSLQMDAAEISKKFSKQKEGTSNVKSNSGSKAKNEKVVTGQRQDTKGTERDGTTSDGSRKEGAKKVRKTKVTVKKATPKKKVVAKKQSETPKRSDADTNKAAQKQMDNADKALGDDWMMEHPKLMEMLKQKKFGAFEKEVAKLAAESKTERKESFASKHPGLLAMLNKNKEPNKKSTAENSKKGKKFDSILGMLFKGAVPKHIRDHFHFVNNADELNALFPEDKDKASADTGGLYRRNVSIDGTAEDVVFVMDNIKEGTEMALFLHEVGSHLGLDSLFSNLDTRYVVDKIEDWFRSEPTMPLMKGGRLNPKDPVAIARRAMDRVGVAVSRGSLKTNRDVDSEIIAYFIQFAVEAGVKPSAVAEKGSIENVASLVLKAYKKALVKLGMLKAGVDELTALDLVDLSLGAAQQALFEFGSSERELRMLRKDAKEAARSQASINPKKNKEDLSNTRKVIHGLFGDTGIQHWETFSHAMKRSSNETKFLHSFIEENKIKMPGASVWFDLILKAEETVNKIKRHVEGVAVQAREMSEERLTVVNKFLADSTLNRAWGYDPKFKSRKVKVDKAMSKRFNALQPSEQKLVKEIFAHGETMIQRKRDIAKAKGVSDKFFQTGVLDGPYAPLKRFGNFVTTLKSESLIKAEKAYALRANKINRLRLNNLRDKESHFVVKFFDTIGEANRFKNEKKALYKSATTTEKIKTVSEGNISNHKVLGKVLGTMKSANLDPAAYKSMEALVQEMYMSSLDENNARESQAKREGVAGFESNMIRSFLSHSRAEANLISQMEHGSDIAAALVNAEQEAKTDPEKLVPVYNMLVSHYTSMLDGKETPIQNAVAAFNTVWMLTSSIGYHFTNATQPLMVTVPVLAAVFGDYKGTMKALLPMFGTGYQVARDVVTFKKQNDKFFHRQAEVDFSKLDPKYLELFKALQDRKLLDVGMEQDLAEFTRLNTGSAVLNKASGAASDVTHRLYQAARVVEMYNRVSTAIAAHDMATKKPGKIKHMGMTPVQFALKIVQDTQGDFSNTDAPRILKRLPKLMVQYRKYQFMMGWVYANAAKAAWAGSTKEEKAVGYKTLGYMLMHAGMFGGVRGLPFIGAVAGAFSLFSGGEEPEDIERIIGEYIEDEALATLIARGLPSLIGIDMSTKLSQDKIFHPAPFVDFEASQEGIRDVFFGTLLGPTANTASNAVRSVEFASEGNPYRSIESAMPKGIKTIMEAWRLGTEGYSLKNGDIPADPSQFNKLTLIAHALGIPAKDVNKIKWTRGQQYELAEYFSKEQQSIRNEYIRADKAGDYDRMSELEDEFDNLQDAKDGVRPFFNDNYGSLKRTSIKSLILAPVKQELRQGKYARELGTD